MQKGMHRAISSTVTSFAGLQIQQKHYTSLIVKINSEVFCSSKVETMARSSHCLVFLIVYKSPTPLGSSESHCSFLVGGTPKFRTFGYPSPTNHPLQHHPSGDSQAHSGRGLLPWQVAARLPG